MFSSEIQMMKEVRARSVAKAKNTGTGNLYSKKNNAIINLVKFRLIVKMIWRS